MRVEHPDISRILQTGLQPDDDGFRPECPVCKQECRVVYVTLDGDVVGCDRCIRVKDAYDHLISNGIRRNEL